MKIVIITVAGVSSRFNKDVPDDEKILKCLYYNENPQNTLIYHMLKKSNYADKIIIVGGYKYSDLENYIDEHVSLDLKDKINLVFNDHYSDLSSGYSLYLGIDCALNNFIDIDEILFVEGDLDIDDESFSKVIKSEKNVLTFNHEPIYSNKAVVLYQNENDEYKYLFNSDHGLLKIANDNFYENIVEDTNLGIIQKYFDLVENKGDIEIIGLKHWVNCNTRDDYQLIKDYWEEN